MWVCNIIIRWNNKCSNKNAMAYLVGNDFVCARKWKCKRYFLCGTFLAYRNILFLKFINIFHIHDDRIYINCTTYFNASTFYFIYNVLKKVTSYISLQPLKWSFYDTTNQNTMQDNINKLSIEKFPPYPAFKQNCFKVEFLIQHWWIILRLVI